jgi:PleD family two-component response regulator
VVVANRQSLSLSPYREAECGLRICTNIEDLRWEQDDAGQRAHDWSPGLTDQHTGLANRLHFELVYSYLFGAGDRGIALTTLLVSVGSSELETENPNLLREIGEKFLDCIRTADLVGHLGHGRFVVLLLGSNLQGARIAADRIESALGPISPAPLSIGLASFQPEMKESAALLEAADRALRGAEAAGGGLGFA